jgi:hypothetical protein
VLVIQNEGPREAFREKLDDRMRHWGIDTPARIWDEPARWGDVKMSDADRRAELRRVVELHRIDLVVADSLTRFGITGNGTPEETRAFVEWLTEIGLGRDVAFLVLHHPLTRPDPSLAELEQIAGSWPPHTDAILMLKKLDGNRARLSFPKVRYGRADPPAAILAFDPETQAFTFVALERDQEERDLVAEITELLGDGMWRTVKEIAGRDGGIGKREEDVKETLAAHPDLFESRTKDAAKEVGRHPSAIVWQRCSDPPGAPVAPTPSTGGWDAEVQPAPDIREQVHLAQHLHLHHAGAPDPSKHLRPEHLPGEADRHEAEVRGNRPDLFDPDDAGAS